MEYGILNNKQQVKVLQGVTSEKNHNKCRKQIIISRNITGTV